MLNLAKIQELMSKLNNWSLDGEMITKEVDCVSFKEAMGFVNDIAEIVERMVHHPSIMVDGNIVRLGLTTHKERCLTEKDFEVASEIDKLRW